MNRLSKEAFPNWARQISPVEDRSGSTLSRNHLFVLMGGYFAVAAIGLAHHEMWGDELQAWMLARDSRSIPDLLHNMRDEGHPAAWHVLLFLLSRFTRDPAAMQILHLVLATATIFVIVRWAPFTVLQKTLLAFGYFFIYEYAVISRGYVLGALALFGICAALPLRKRSYLPLAFPLVVLANTSAYGLLLAFALGAMLLAEWATDRHLRADFAGSTWDPWLALVLAVAGGVAAMVQLLPPYDSDFSAPAVAARVGWSRWRVADSLSAVWSGYVPIPLLSTPHRWDTNLLADGGRWPLFAAMLLSVALLLAAVVLLARTPYALLFFLLGSGGVVAFTYLVWGGNTRHYGHTFLVLLASLWIARSSSLTETLVAPLRGLHLRVSPWRNWWLTILLVLQMIAGAILYLEDLRKPFSIAKRTASFLQESGLDTLPIVGSPSLPASALAGHLDRQFFDLANGRFGAFVAWGFKGGKEIQAVSTVDRARSLVTSETPTLLLALGDSLPEDARDSGVRPVAYFAPGIVPGERYYLYLVRRKLAPASEQPR